MKCKFEHDEDCCNSGAKQYMCKCKQPCDTIVPMTNADRIRAMSDEELAEFLESTNTNMAIKLGGEYIVRAKEYIEIWLEQPAEEG